MNIREASEQIIRTVRSYRVTKPDGTPLIPVESRRPVYLEGAPGLGKTAIVSQAAKRLGLTVLSYTMTHHTRQSALGLPELRRMTLGGREVTVTEYTVPEIIADVLRTGEDEGILFLDEINCVSESLNPAMLELLQHKRFGSHSLPEGWVILCAGNPERYNRAARAFDAVTLDRVRMLRVEPDAEAWQVFAAESGVRPEIRGYLRLRPQDLYLADGANVVTPRSWTDLSLAMDALEALGETTDRKLYGQYLQNEETLERFTMYCAVCAGVRTEDAAKASFEEKLCVAELLADRAGTAAKQAADARRLSDSVSWFTDALRDTPATELLKTGLEQLDRRRAAFAVQREAGLLTPEKEKAEADFRVSAADMLARAAGSADAWVIMRNANEELRACAEEARNEAESIITDALRTARTAFTEPYLRAVFSAALRARPDAAALVRKLDPQLWHTYETEQAPDARAEMLREKLLAEKERARTDG